ncbi:MAG: hypothetical protein ACO3GA_04780, partial [Candidatus Limnocylindrus sp.]
CSNQACRSQAPRNKVHSSKICQANLNARCEEGTACNAGQELRSKEDRAEGGSNARNKPNRKASASPFWKTGHNEKGVRKTGTKAANNIHRKAGDKVCRETCTIKEGSCNARHQGSG